MILISTNNYTPYSYSLSCFTYMYVHVSIIHSFILYNNQRSAIYPPLINLDLLINQAKSVLVLVWLPLLILFFFFLWSLILSPSANYFPLSLSLFAVSFLGGSVDNCSLICSLFLHIFDFYPICYLSLHMTD